MILTKDELHSPLWLKLKEHYEARLSKLRIENDADRPEAETIKHRGRIDEVKKFLAHGTPKKEHEVE